MVNFDLFREKMPQKRDKLPDFRVFQRICEVFLINLHPGYETGLKNVFRKQEIHKRVGHTLEFPFSATEIRVQGLEPGPELGMGVLFRVSLEETAKYTSAAVFLVLGVHIRQEHSFHQVLFPFEQWV